MEVTHLISNDVSGTAINLRDLRNSPKHSDSDIVLVRMSGMLCPFDINNLTNKARLDPHAASTSVGWFFMIARL